MPFRDIDHDLWGIVQKYLPPTKPHIGRPRCNPHGLFNGVPYVLTTGCTWLDVPAKYGAKSTVHRYHLELCEKGVYQVIFLNLLQAGYEIKKKSVPLIVRRIPRISRKKRDRPAMMAVKKVKENKLSVLVNRKSFPLSFMVAPADIHDSRLYDPTLEAFEIPEVLGRPIIISADVAYDAREIRRCNRKRGIKINIPVNQKFRKQLKRGRPFRSDPELYKKRSAVERFFSCTEAFKKIVPRYERHERSFMGLIHLACTFMIGRILG